MADHHHHHHHQQQQQQQEGGHGTMIMTSSTSTSSMREYRKGNWTVHETMVLIEAKRMDEERRMKRSSSSSGGGGGGGGESTSEGGAGNVVMRSRPAELRWKWVEDYCWSNGCLRSQNQCNDKWDNLMRDYKKVRDYERRLVSLVDSSSQQQQQQQQQQQGSYWKLEKHERKDRNLPTNMLPQIYEALVELLERRSTVTNTSSYALPITSNTHHHHHQPSSSVLPPTPITIPTTSHQQNPSPLHQQPLPLPPPQPSPTTFDSDTSDHSNSPAKRRRRGGGGGEQGTTSTSTYNEGVGSAISRGATIIAEALHACEEREERRHRECLSVQERRLKIEESKTETDREAINGLVHAINNLATSIFALVSDKSSSQQTTPPK